MYGVEMPEGLAAQVIHDPGSLLWNYNQRLVFIDERIEEVEQELANLRRRRQAQVAEVIKLMERYYDIRRDNATD